MNKILNKRITTLAKELNIKKETFVDLLVLDSLTKTKWVEK